MATFDDLLKETGLPEPALAPLREKYNEALALITKNNERVAQVNAAKAQDPNNLEYIDSLWAAHFKSDPKMVEIEEKFQIASAEYEKHLKALREFGRTKVQPPLSEDETKNVRKLVNDSGPAIQTAKAQFAAMASMVDAFLTSMSKGIEGGLVSLLPEADSLKNVRGRKASTSSGIGTYMTRIGAFEINGRNIHRDGKTNFRYGADSVSTLFGSEKFPENKVTGEEIEEAYFKSLDKETRSLSSSEIPETHTFTFTKDCKIGEGVSEKRSVEITVKRKQADAKPETETETKPAESKPTENTEAPKAESKPEAKQEVPTPAKKVEPAKATPAKK